MLSRDEYRSYDALGLAELIRKREVTAPELLKSALAAAKEQNPKLNAIIHMMDDSASRQIQTGLPAGPLRGVPFLIKDLGIQCEGEPTRSGSRFFAGTRSGSDCELMTHYRSLGLSIFGKTNTPELALCCTTEPVFGGATHNPWALDRSPGGSSGGSAAAVAAGIVPAAHGTDSAGSIRIPASDCGVFGLMPSRGRAPLDLARDPLGVSRPHVMTRTVRDSAVFLNAKADPAKPNVAGLRIAFAADSPSGCAVDPECRAAAELAARLCGNLGHHIEVVTPPVPIEPILDAAPLLCFLRFRLDEEAKRRESKLTSNDFEATTWALLEYASKTSGTAYARAIANVHNVARMLDIFFRDYDVLLSPVLANPPMPLGTFDMNRMSFDEYMTRLYVEHMPFTRQFNFSGGPAMSVPMRLTADNRPIGVQFGAGIGRDDMLLDLAAQIEEAHPWPRLAINATDPTAFRN